MPVFEIGLFLLTLGFAFIFTVLQITSIMPKGFGHIIAMILFLVLAVVMLSGYEVSMSTTTTDGTVTWTENKVFITGGVESSWFGYVFLGLAVMSLILLIRDIFMGE